jgi:hypothetical protein
LAGQYAEESIASIPAKLLMSASRKRLLNVPHSLIEWSQDLIEFIVATQKQQHEEVVEAARLAEEEKKRLEEEEKKRLEEEEKQRLEDEDNKRIESEKKRVEEEERKRLADETAKLAAEEEARRLEEEAEKKRQAEEAENARKQQGKAIVTSDESDSLSILQDLQQRMHV